MFSSMHVLGQSTLQKKVGLAVLVGLVIGLGLFALLGIQSINASTERTLDERLTVAQLVASHTDETLTYIKVQLQSAANFGGALPGSERFATAANSLRAVLDKSGISVQNVLLFDGNGQLRAVEPEDQGLVGPDTPADYQEVKEVLAAKTPTISGMISQFSTQGPVVLAAAPILDAQGRSIGAMGALIDVSRSTISALTKPITPGKTGYAEIVDKNGVVLARSEPGQRAAAFEMSDHPGRFAQLIEEGQATRGTCHRCHTASGEQPLRRQDVLAFAPLSNASWGVVIRQAEEEALAPADQLRQRFLLLGALVMIGGLLGAWIVTQRIVKPIRQLTASAARLATGDFSVPISIERRDEIGQLSAAFSTMTQQLAKSREELIRRNEALSALNSVAVAISQSLKLEDVLASAIAEVLDVTKAKGGCVLLLGEDRKECRMMSSVGSLANFDCQESLYSNPICACNQAMRTGRTMVITEAGQCAMLSGARVSGEDISGFVSVPLKSKERVLGIMNIAYSDEWRVTEMELAILDSVGYHMGLAIENAMLYEEARQKEELRGQLLARVISAQEEERKRIARELHDEFGQTMTGLIMSIESIEAAIPTRQAQLQKHMANARARAVQALDELRKLTLGLRPSVLDDLGLVAAVRSYAQSYLEARNVRLRFDAEGISGRLDPSVETALFRIVQEAIHNTVKHANARSVQIRLKAGKNKIVATVEDDGGGFDVDDVLRPGSRPHSLGLLGIRERVHLLGGTFNIKSQAGQGTQLTVEIPINGSLQRAAGSHADRQGQE